jgi:hypothetical protein
MLVLAAAICLFLGLLSQRGTALMLAATVAGAGAILLIAIVVGRSGIRPSARRP